LYGHVPSDGQGNVAYVAEKKKYTKIWSEILKGRDQLKNVDLGRRWHSNGFYRNGLLRFGLVSSG
jgi:hypothetical protein